MDVVWQDSGASFLDSSGTDPTSFATFAGGDGGTLWSSAADSPVFSDQSLLWDSGADAPAASYLSGLTADNGSGTDTSPLLTGGWIADGTSELASGSPSLNGGLLWAGTGDTSAALSTSSGLGSLGSLDLGASSTASSLWQQFVDGFGPQVATWAADLPHLLWTGASSQPLVTAPVLDGSQSLPLAAGGSLPSSIAGTLAPTQLVWAQPSAATGLVTGPNLADAAPTPVISGTGIVGASSSPLPVAGVGSHA
jgi:hypothetical protein